MRLAERIITVRTGSRPAVVDITAEAAGSSAGRGDGLLHVFVPHATAGVAIIETGAGSDDDLLRRSTTCCQPTTGGGTGTARRATAATT